MNPVPLLFGVVLLLVLLTTALVLAITFYASTHGHPVIAANLALLDVLLIALTMFSAKVFKHSVGE